MAAPADVHACCQTNTMEPTTVAVFHDREHLTNISSQLLYPEAFGESYREDKLTVLGKGGAAAAKGPQKTVEMPQSSVLSRIKSFLPQLATANKDMAQELADNPDSADRFNIEHVEDSADVQVEMNLSLVPPELLETDGSTTEDSSSESDSEDDGESHSQVDEMLAGRDVEQQSLRLRTSSSKPARPSIEIIDDVRPQNDTGENCLNR